MKCKCTYDTSKALEAMHATVREIYLIYKAMNLQFKLIPLLLRHICVNYSTLLLLICFRYITNLKYKSKLIGKSSFSRLC